MLDDAERVYSILQEHQADVIVDEDTGRHIDVEGTALTEINADIITVIGGDRVLLGALLELGNVEIPVLPLSSAREPSFLFETEASSFDGLVSDILEGKWTLEKRARIQADIAGVSTPPILNDLAIFARRSATLVRYSLYIDKELFLKDTSDGLIISTPTGSTAYSMSVGGPVVMNPAPVMSIVPVNSVNPAQRPVVVPDNKKIEIRDLSSRVTVEAVLDGQERRSIDSDPIVVHRAEKDALFLKFSEERVAALRGKLKQKTDSFEDLAQDLPPSAKLILKTLEYEGELTQKEIIEETLLPARTVRYALAILISDRIVEKHVSLRDSRQSLYRVADRVGVS
jgi:NAD+ kinase